MSHHFGRAEKILDLFLCADFTVSMCLCVVFMGRHCSNFFSIQWYVCGTMFKFKVACNLANYKIKAKK